MIPYSTPLWTIFTKCPAPGVAEVAPAVGRGEHVEDRREPLDGLLVAADHHAVADLEAPDAAATCRRRRSGCPSASSSSARRTSSCQFVLPPSTIVSPASSSSGERVDRLLGRVAGRDHHPHHARRVELGDEVLERGRAGRAVPLGGRRPPPRRSRTRRPRGRSRGGCDGPCCRPSCRGRRSRSASELLLESGDRAGQVAGVQPHADGREAVVAQRLQVAVGLRVDERAERVRLARDVERRASRRGRAGGSGRSAGPPLWNWPVECRKRGP